jgi:hypothetical protein
MRRRQGEREVRVFARRSWIYASEVGVLVLVGLVGLSLGIQSAAAAPPPGEPPPAEHVVCSAEPGGGCEPVKNLQRATRFSQHDNVANSPGHVPSMNQPFSGGSYAGFVEWGIQYTSSQIRYWYASTVRTSGTGAHALQVHGALVKDWYGNQSYAYEFGPNYGYNETITGGTTDSWHNKDGKWWRVASGHSYDHGNNGTVDYTCDGCMDAINQF